MKISNLSTRLLVLSGAILLTAGLAQAQGTPSAPTVRSQAETPDGRDPSAWRAQRWKQMAFGDGATSATAQIDGLPDYIRRYREANIYDPVLAVFSVAAKPASDGTTNSITLEGEVGLRWYKSGLEQMLTGIGFHVAQNHIRLLPEDTLGPNAYARATTTAATMRKHPKMESEQVNAITLGWPLRLLRQADDADLTGYRPERRRDDEPAPVPYHGDWFLAQSSEGYIGFVREDQVQSTDDYRLPDMTLPGSTVLDRDEGPVKVPGGAGLYWDESHTSLRVPTENGLVNVPMLFQNVDSRLSSQTIIRLAKPLMATPYVWGGVTEEGIDCSGFTQYMYRLLGVNLPRDARPQSVVGRISAFGEAVERDAQAGDLVYFADESGRISHIGMALGDGQLIHSSGGAGVHVCDYHEVSRSRPNGMLERVLYARRIRN